MNRKSGIKSAAVISFIVILVFISGCTKEKAEAIKVAAEQFLVSANTAENKIEYLLLQSVSMPFMNEEERVNEIAKKLNEHTGNITPDILNHILTENRIGEDANKIIRDKFKKLKYRVRMFESMFHSLPAGSYFAKDAVEKAEKHAINLTVEYINFATYVQKIHVQFTGRLTLICEKLNNKDRILPPGELRTLNITLSAQDLVKLGNDQTRGREEALRQCYKASEKANLVANLIRNYGKLSVGDILAMTKDTLGFANKISGGSLDSLMSDYKSVATAIKEDEYWSKLLDNSIN